MGFEAVFCLGLVVLPRVRGIGPSNRRYIRGKARFGLGLGAVLIVLGLYSLGQHL